MVATGHSHSAVISSEGKLFTFGCGESGRLGLGGNQNRRTPEHVAKLADVKLGYVACGSNHTVSERSLIPN